MIRMKEPLFDNYFPMHNDRNKERLMYKLNKDLYEVEELTDTSHYQYRLAIELMENLLEFLAEDELNHVCTCFSKFDTVLDEHYGFSQFSGIEFHGNQELSDVSFTGIYNVLWKKEKYCIFLTVISPSTRSTNLDKLPYKLTTLVRYGHSKDFRGVGSLDYHSSNSIKRDSLEEILYEFRKLQSEILDKEQTEYERNSYFRQLFSRE